MKGEKNVLSSQITLPVAKNEGTSNKTEKSGGSESTSEPKKSKRKSTIDSVVGLTESDKKLKMHPCHIERVYNYATKRMNKVITCLYDGCGKQFTKTWNILDHFKVHTGDKPYKCESCSKTFSQKGNLTKHLKLHTKCNRASH